MEFNEFDSSSSKSRAKQAEFESNGCKNLLEHIYLVIKFSCLRLDSVKNQTKSSQYE